MLQRMKAVIRCIFPVAEKPCQALCITEFGSDHCSENFTKSRRGMPWERWTLSAWRVCEHDVITL